MFNKALLKSGKVVEAQPAVSKFKKGDRVQLTSGRDVPRTGVIRSASQGSVVLEWPLGGYCTWSASDIELAVSEPKENNT